MTGLKRSLALFAVAITASGCSAQAEDFSECTVATIEDRPVEGLKCGTGLFRTYPAKDVMAALRNETDANRNIYLGRRVTGITCRRDSMVPIESDYALISTGFSFILREDIKDLRSNSLVIYWNGGAFAYKNNGAPLSTETKKMLEKRLADFSRRGIKPDAVRELGLRPHLNFTPKDSNSQKIQNEQNGLKISANDTHCTN